MRRLLIPAVLIALIAASAWHYRDLWLPRAPYDGQANRYRISIDDSAAYATVTASIWLDNPMLSMFDVQPIDALPGGHVDLVEDLQVLDSDGATVALRDLGYGDFAARGGQRLQLSYRVRLQHDQYTWPAGVEEVAYRTDEGLMFRVSTLLFADGGEAMQGPFEVEFELPAGWRAHTPWQAADKPLSFTVATRRELLSNVIFLGTAQTETIEAGGVAMTLVLGKRYLPQVQLFRELLDTQMRSYQAMFGGNPLSPRYLIIINEGASGDGGAFSSSFSQFIPGDASVANRVVWGHTMAHELLHFWNGLSLIPADYREEWFKEGVTDYLTIASMAKNGFSNETLLLKRLENLQRRDVLARYLQRLDMSIRDSGRDKQPNRLLVYGGGALTAFALDAELRLRSDNRVGLEQVMAAMYAEFGKPGARYRLDDLIRVCSAVSGTDFSEFFARTVESTTPFDLHPTLKTFGLRLDSFVEEIYLSHDASADAAARARFAAAFSAENRAAVPAQAAVAE